MRLFLAVDFPDRVKADLARITNRLRMEAASGVFTRRENHHLTLVFLGETMPERIPQITGVMDKLRTAAAAVLTTAGLGRFRRPDGDLYWLGLAPSAALEAVQGALEAGLTDQGFPLERRAFRPHLTLGRRVAAGPPLDWAPPRLALPMTAVTLMESHRRTGHLTYRPLQVVELDGGNPTDR